MEPYLVLFVADPATDEHAAELRVIAHHAAQLHPWDDGEPRFFDQIPDGSDERTVGVHLRVTTVAEADRTAVAALVHAVADAASRLGVRIEAQLAGEPIGVLSEGAIDMSVAEALREFGVELG